MRFAHPGLAFAAALLALLPLVIHLLTRPQPRRLRFSAMRFLSEVDRDRRRRSQLRDALVLTLRVLAVICVGASIARLFPARSSAARPADPLDRIVILDVSRSMGARHGGVGVHERARAIASSYLAYRPGLRAGLILAGSRASPAFEELSSNLGALIHELRGARVRPEELDPGLSLALAARMFAAPGPGSRRQLVIVSDMQATNWDKVDLSVIPPGIEIYMEPVEAHHVPGNLAVTSITIRSVTQQGQRVAVAVEVSNYSPLVRPAHVEIRVDEGVQRTLVEIGPWETRAVTVEVATARAGWLAGEASLIAAEDDLPDDDHRRFVVPVVPAPSVGILSGEPARRLHTTSYFLERALAPPGSGSHLSPIGPVERLDPGDARKELLAGLGVLLVARPGPMSPELVRSLAGLLVRGKGILYVVEDLEDSANLLRLGRELGPALSLPVTFLPPATVPTRRGLALGRLQIESPPFDELSEGLLARLRVTGLTRGLETRPSGSGQPQSILAEYSDGTAALISVRVRAGKLAVLNARISSSDLVRSALFVPLVNEVARSLLASPDAGTAVAATGSPFSFLLPVSAGGAAGLHVAGRDDRPQESMTVEECPDGVLVRGSCSEPGVYLVRHQASTVFAYAVECPAAESDLRPLGAQVLQTRSHRPIRVAAGSGTGEDEASPDVWRILALGAALSAIAELMVLAWLRT